MSSKVSIIIPVFNAESSLDRCLESVLNQDFTSVEVILVNDGSTDGSAVICDRYASEDERIVVIHKENGGVSSARNAGIDAASGEYIMFLDSDDVLGSVALEQMYGRSCDMVMGGFRKVAQGKTQYSRIPKCDRVYAGEEQMCLFLDENIGKSDCFMLNSSCFKLYKRSVVQENGLRFDHKLRYGEDKMFVFNFLKYASSVRTVDAVVYDYILAADSLSSDVKSDSHLSQVFLLLEAYVPLLSELCQRYPCSQRLKDLYHVDVVSRYVMRILTCFATRRSELMTKENLTLLYSYMKGDKALNLFSVRFLQVPNLLLQRIGSAGFAKSFYSLTSSICRYISFK